MRTARKDVAFYEVLQVLDFAYEPLSGLTSSDFGVVFYYNSAVVNSPPSFTIAEIGSTGNYAFSTTFTTSGFWSVLVTSREDGEDIETQMISVTVTDKNIDDVYSAVYEGGVGLEIVNITVVNSDNNNSPIPSVRIDIFDSTGNTFITYGKTNSSGVFRLAIDPGTYSFRGFLPGYKIPVSSISVSDTAGQTEHDQTVSATGAVIVTPSSPSLCRIYADIIDQNGNAVPDFVITVTNRFVPQSVSTLAVIGKEKQYKTDSSGHVEMDLVSGITVTASLAGTPLTREFVVPGTETANLFTLLGDITDLFAVVEAPSTPSAVVGADNGGVTLGDYYTNSTSASSSSDSSATPFKIVGAG